MKGENYISKKEILEKGRRDSQNPHCCSAGEMDLVSLPQDKCFQQAYAPLKMWSQDKSV
jgi:hypothetical protein